MTTQQTERVDVVPTRTASTVSASRAYQRRLRRQQALEGARLTRTGSPIASALTRVPFVAMIILLLAGGIVGVLWLNTMSDAAGLRASQSRLDQLALSTSIQAASRQIATLKDPAVLAAQAQSLGLVPPGNAAMLEIGKDGKGTVIGTPTPVPVAAPPAAPATPTPATTVATAALATTPLATATVAKQPAANKPATSAGSTVAKPGRTPAPGETAKAKTTPAAPKSTTVAKATSAKTTSAKTTTATSTTAANRSRQAPATTGAGQ